MLQVDTLQSEMKDIPRLRWSPTNHRFHYNLPLTMQPGTSGFVLLTEFEHPTSYGTWILPKEEMERLEEMERVNMMIHDLEVADHLHDILKRMKDARHSKQAHASQQRQQQQQQQHQEQQQAPPQKGTRAYQLGNRKAKDKKDPKQHMNRKFRPTKTRQIKQP